MCDKEIPILNCIIVGEINPNTYKVEVICPGGGTHTHGLDKNEIETNSHRVDDCNHLKNGYYLFLPKDEVVTWDRHKI